MADCGTPGGCPPGHNILVSRFTMHIHHDTFIFVISHLILTPLSFSPSCRRDLDYEGLPLFVPIKENRLINEFFRPKRCQRQGPSLQLVAYIAVLPSPVRRSRLLLPRRRPRWRGELLWGCDASAFPGTCSVVSFRPHHRGGAATIRRFRQPWT